MAQQIHAAILADIPRLQAIEVAAGRVFAEWGMAEVAAHAPPSAAEFGRYIELEQAWVMHAQLNDAVVQAEPELAGFVLVETVDRCAHIEQLSVHPDFARRRLGAELIEQVVQWAVLQKLAALTLTTFAELPWNAPYYGRCGFLELSVEQQTPGLKQKRAHEASLGLDAWPRVCMRREL